MEASSFSFQGSIVIPSWNGATILAKSLPKLGILNGGPWEILVVDHGRLNRETEMLVRNFPFVRYLGLDEQLGFAGAVNYGANLASADLVAVMCNDLLVDPDWMTAFAIAAENEKSIPTVWFSKVRREPHPLSVNACMNFWMRVVESPKEVTDFLVPDGSSFCFRKSLVGLPFLSEYYLYQEDVYLGWFTRLKGGKVIRVEASTAINFDGGTTKRTKAIVSYYTERNRWLNYFYFLSGSSLVRAAPSLVFDLFLRLFFGKNRFAKVRALAWCFFQGPSIWRKRNEIQSMRKVEDRELLLSLSGIYDSHQKWLNHIFQKLNNVCGFTLGP